MKLRICTFAMVVSLFGFAPRGWAQSGQAGSASGSAAASAKSAAQATAPSASEPAAAVRAGTKISAQLQSSLDAKTAKPGDEVVARVTKNVKQNGQVVVHKGDRLIGHVTSVQAASSSKASSELSVAFNRLAHGETTTQLNTVVTALLSASSAGGQGSDMMEPGPIGMPQSGAAPSGGGRSGGGGILGGAVSGVGSTVGAVGSTVGGAAGSVSGVTQSTVGGAAQAGLATPLKAVHINAGAHGESQSSTTSNLSTQHGNLKLDSGTQMQFRVAAEGSAQ